MVEISQEIREIIERNALALASIDEKGNPHCIAIGSVKVIPKNQILIGNCFMVQTIKNIKRNSEVSICAWNRNWEDNCLGYELLGKAEYFTDGVYLEKVKKIHAGFDVKGALVVTVSKIIKLS
jgi:predicted pyridoxine 5'-phosphate oxidase superfamily flavin-nucleotide-binding protein